MRTIFVVDDDPDVRALTRRHLEGASFAVTELPDGQELLDELQAGARPDVIVLDLIMGQRSGWATLAEIKKTAGIDAIPVVILTSAADDTFRSGAERAGAASYVTKPFEPWEIVNAVRNAIGLPDEYRDGWGEAR